MKDLTRYAVGYALWAISIVIAGLVGLIVRETFVTGLVMSASSTMGVDARRDFYLGYQLRAVDPWTYVVYGLLLITLIVFLEHFYREGVMKGRLLPRFMLVTAIELGLLALAHTANFVYGFYLDSVSWLLLALALIELLLVGVFIWLYRRLPTQPAMIQ